MYQLHKLYTFLPFTIDTASQRELYSSTKTEAMKSLYRNCYSNNLLHYCTDIMSKHKGKQPMHGPRDVSCDKLMLNHVKIYIELDM